MKSTSISAVIIDDEPLAREALAGLLAQYVPGVKIVGTAGEVNEGKEVILETRPQLVFLDIEMPGRDGFHLLEAFPEPDFETVFVTAYDEFALKAFQHSAMDYLLKPIEPDALKQAVEKVKKQLAGSQPAPDYSFLMEMVKGQTLDRLAIPTLNGLEMVPLKDIIRAQAEGNYTTLFTRQDRKILSSKPIGFFDELLTPQLFQRVHHSHLVNLREIISYQRGRGGQVTMSDGAVVDVSVRRKKELLDRLKG